MGGTQQAMATRDERLKHALFRGGRLTLENADYRRTVRAFIDVMLCGDLGAQDLTTEALGAQYRSVSAAILAQEKGVVAGLAEVAFMLSERGVQVALEKKDGDAVGPGDVLMRAKGEEIKLLSFERVGLNLLQRMSGIATAARCLQERARRCTPTIHIVGTRKTPCGLLDKRALHLGNGGTHRLGLADAIVIKNNHLALLASREEEAVPSAIEKAWKFRNESAFIEIEVRTEGAARAAAKTFWRLQQEAPDEYPCLLMLDNMSPGQIKSVVGTLRQEGLWNSTLIEASGGVSETNLEAYAACGVDAISIGALTHSVRALDISQRMS
jgi:nicotinate-nucleotide pyrophosphorylase (carboxylating)